MMNIHASPTLTPAESALVEAFSERVSDLPGDAAVTVMRDDAVELLKGGLPTRRIEAWHYTDLRRLLTAVPAFEPSAKPDTLRPLIDGSAVLRVSQWQGGERFGNRGCNGPPFQGHVAGG
ncbi:MAG: hypothetical protein KL801_07290 [Mesorhizobium sp.]|nr:hypothetical protein [Mesorhizobium sp.]